MVKPRSAGEMGVTRRAALGAVTAAAATPPMSAIAAPSAPTRAPSLLYPHESPSRAVRDLSGLWRFQLDPGDEGEAGRWFEGLPRSRAIPVPCSWNDLFDEARNYFGAGWYETEFHLDPGWRGRRVHLRFGSAVYRAKVWLNGVLLGEHVGGHLPFAFEVTRVARLDGPNRLVVMVENKLRLDRVPAIPDPDTAELYTAHFPQTTYDFFPYAGLHRPVWLFTTPAVHLHDVTVTTGLEGARGAVHVALVLSENWSGRARLTLEGGPRPVRIDVSVRAGEGEGVLSIDDVRPWSPKDPFLYRLAIEVGEGPEQDVYSLKVGVRTVEVRDDRILLNGEPVFLTGFGKHEDFIIHGRGLDLPVLVRDYELLKWIGANSFRTSHYPYSEEAMMLADEYGFLVIGETPGVSLVFGDRADVIEARYVQLEHALGELIARDRNHPSVVMWSLANEPILKPFQTTGKPPSGAAEAGTRFFGRLFARARQLDPSRPVTLVSVQGGPDPWIDLADVVCVNSYNGWYSTSGRLDEAEVVLNRQIDALRARHPGKPVIFTEFGADAVVGMHAEPDEMWTEEFQADLIEMYWRTLRKRDFVVGAHPWAFADFRTPQSTLRVGALNHKGVFTRDRRPKLAAHRLKELWAPLHKG